MNIPALKRAQDGLSLLDIQQFKFDGFLSDDYEPGAGADEYKISFQNKKLVDSSSILEFSEEGSETSYIFRVEVELGIRYVAASEDAPETDEASLLAQIEASYRVDYVIKDKALRDDREALDEFALNNAPHHVWSFWREYVDSQAGRMRLPRAMMPMMTSIANP